MEENSLNTAAAALRHQVEAASLDSAEELEHFRIRFLGQKNGRITRLFKHIPQLPPKERRDAGRLLNELRTFARAKLEAARTSVTTEEAAVQGLDLTLPGRSNQWPGSRHPITQALAAIKDIFIRMGFAVAEGPEIEDDWHNFTALNFPVDHPARDMQDTLFVEASDQGTGGVMLRTHTSPVQIRTMLAGDPPFRLIAPGRVYRNEAITYKSYCLFHQVEGLVVDTGVTMADLKHTLFGFARAFFGDDVRLRFRPSFFPFTEPSAELDVWWALPEHPKGGRWMEILGSGMVHPNVLEAVGVDPERYTGYAFGMGVERPAMLRYGISDIRTFYENDLRFLDQF
ncbi:MAG: phenylalanine--tRNA ligase subunit alpha [Bacteroidota bacterium]|nr:phenylalanine--tRNA ligase subunit alpha [Bacteroidota bacterium]MDE2833811.1 phenylalanine--tRNA ligase subunit alpha [Bacteroidota bacterium]MDE2955870.1 phenylalanine--tRNA ligase subunit alpha [Bacteroidota bacterium]